MNEQELDCYEKRKEGAISLYDRLMDTGDTDWLVSPERQPEKQVLLKREGTSKLGTS